MTRGTAELTIAVLLPDLLGTYSDAGNAVVLAERARRRGIPSEVLTITIADTPPHGADIYVLGGGEDAAQHTAARWLHRHQMRAELADRHVVLAVCAGFQLLGTTIADRDGRIIDGLDALDITTQPGRRRAVGEVVATACDPSIGKLTGFENHSGLTTLGPAVRPLAVLDIGAGNGTQKEGQPTEGAITPTIVGTYLHGPVLARNPALADLLLTRATGQRLRPLELPDQHEMRNGYLQRRLRRRPLRQLITGDNGPSSSS